jgi:hypothetical protein
LDATDLSRLSDAIAHAVAPTFLLGATAAFIALLMGRLNGILDRIRYVNLIEDQDLGRASLRSDLPRLKRRAKLLNGAILMAVASAVCTVALVILSFGSALLGFHHQPGVAVMFVLALLLFGISLVSLGREVRIALTEHDFA